MRPLGAAQARILRTAHGSAEALRPNCPPRVLDSLHRRGLIWLERRRVFSDRWRLTSAGERARNLLPAEQFHRRGAADSQSANSLAGALTDAGSSSSDCGSADAGCAL